MRSFRFIAMMLVFAGGLAASAQGRGPGGAGPGGAGPGGSGPGQQRGHGAEPDRAPGIVASKPAPRNGLQLGPAGRWWDNKTTVKIVGITSMQQRKMDVVFDANKPAIVSTYKTLLAEEAKLAQLNKSTQPNQAAVFAQIDAVNQARAALQKATTQMLLQIRQEMVPDQIQKLEQVQ